MAEQVNLVRLNPVREAELHNKPASSQGPAVDESSENQEFSAVLNQTSQQKNQPDQQNNREGSNPSDGNDLATAKNQAVVEEGSSRSASLSPNQDSLAQESSVSKASQLLLGEVGKELFQNVGGEASFLIDAAKQAAALAEGSGKAVQLSEGLGVSVEGQQVDPIKENVARSLAELLQPQQQQVNPEVVAKSVEQVAAPLAEAQAKVAAPEVVLPENNQKIQVDSFAEAPKQATEVALTDKAAEAKPQIEINPEQKVQAQKLVDAGQVVAPEKQSKNEFSRDNFNPFDQANQDAGDKGQVVEKNNFGSLSALELEVEKNIAKQHDRPSINQALEGGALFDSSAISQDRVVVESPAGLLRADDLSQVAKTQSVEQVQRVIPGSLEDQVLRQIRFHLGPNADRVDIRLFPPELGAIRIEFEMQGNHMRARIHASEQITGAMLDKHIPELRSSMQNAGIEVGDVEITSGSEMGNLEFQQPNQSEESSHRNRGNGQGELEDDENEANSGAGRDRLPSLGDRGLDMMV